MIEMLKLLLILLAIDSVPGIITNHIPTEWTTVHAFYEVETFMEVGFSMPNHFSHGTGHNVEIESQLHADNFKPIEDEPVLFNKVREVVI